MPDVTVTVSKISGGLVNLVANLEGASSSFAVKIKDGDNDNMRNTKNDIFKEGDRYDFAFADGKNTLKAQYGVNITKYNGDFQLKIISTIPWNYDCDAKVDHANKGLAPSAWTSSYVRESEYHATPEYYLSSDFVAQAYLVVGDEMFFLDGSNNAFGLEAENLRYRDFTQAESLPSGVDLDIFTIYDDNMIALNRFELKERLGKTYEFTGTYSDDILNQSFNTGNIYATVVVKTVDRKTEDIEITAPVKEVKLLDTGYSTSGDYYILYSDDISDDLMKAYINQGIFTDMSQKATAFSSTGEFQTPQVHYTASGYDNCFAPDYPATHEYYRLKSQSTLKSDKLHKIATGSDCEGAQNPWALEIETYVGQKVKIHWPLHAAPLYDYRFVTNGSDTFQVPIVFEGAPNNITQAKTELELVKTDDASIRVMYSDGTSGYVTKPYDEYTDAKFRLIPKFSLVNATEGVEVEESIVPSLGLPWATNVQYYSQTPSVGIKSALYVRSGSTEFLVPGSDKMYVGETPVTSVTVKQANPIAATQANPVNPTIIDGSGEGLVELMMQDVPGYYIYFNGQARNNTPPYSGTIASIFNAIQFSVYSVNGSTSFSGWSLKDTPDTVTLKTNGIAAGTYTVVIKASTVWKDYYYTVKVNVQ